MLDDTGAITALGTATAYGGMPRRRSAGSEVPTSLSATPTGQGYWVFTTRGRVVAFGDARFLGDVSALRLNGPVLDSVVHARPALATTWSPLTAASSPSAMPASPGPWAGRG